MSPAPSAPEAERPEDHVIKISPSAGEYIKLNKHNM